MILSQTQIREAVDSGEIKFSPPLEPRQWGEASVDLRLGLRFSKLKAVTGQTVSLAKGVSALSGLWQEKELKIEDVLGKKEFFRLEPNEFILAQTYEHIWMPCNLIAMVEGRSSYARAGLSMHQTAPWIQPGWDGHITLEIRNSGPLNIDLTPVDDLPCQLTFFQLSSKLDQSQAYGSKPTDVFQGQTSVLPTK